MKPFQSRHYKVLLSTTYLETAVVVMHVETTILTSKANTLKSSISDSNQPFLVTQKTVEDDKYKLKIDLQGCKRKNQNVSCYFLFTNTGEKDIELFLSSNASGNGWHPSRVIDSSGNEYIAKTAKVSSTVDSQYVKIRLSRNILIKASLDFQIPEQITDLALIEVVYGGGAYNVGQSQFRETIITTLNKNPKKRLNAK